MRRSHPRSSPSFAAVSATSGARGIFEMVVGVLRSQDWEHKREHDCYQPVGRNPSIGSSRIAVATLVAGS